MRRTDHLPHAADRQTCFRGKNGSGVFVPTRVKLVAMLVLAATVLGCGALVYGITHLGCQRYFTTHCSLALADLYAIRSALESYAEDHGGVYPANLEALLAHGEDDPGYLYGRSTLVPDPWRRPYLYEVSADGREFRLRSLGRDGVVGGSGEDEDMLVTSKPASG
jgi:hypothetical protein